MAAILGGTQTAAGKHITVDAAMRCSVPFVCTSVITETLASMPLPVRRKVGRETQDQSKLRLNRALNRIANPGQTAQMARKTATHHALNYGNGFLRLIRENDKPEGEVTGFYVLHPSTFKQKNLVAGVPEYVFAKAGGGEDKFANHQIAHLVGFSDDGITGIGAVELGREPIAQLLAIERYASTFFARGGMVAGMITKSIPFGNEEARKQFREDIEKTYEGEQGYHKKLIVEGGNWDYKTFGSNPTESQLVSARQSMTPEIARYYRLTPHLAGDLSRAHFNNVEHLWIEFINVTLDPLMKAWEQEIFRVFLTPKQQDQDFYAKHTASSFLRGDFEARIRGYATLLQNGVTSINQCRALEDWDPVEGGDAHHIQLNMQTVPGTGAATASETATLMKISSGAAAR